MTTVNAYDYKEIPYFSIDIDADIVGFCMAELLRDEYAKLAKEKLTDMDFDDAVKYCRLANDFQKEIDKAKGLLEKRAEKGEEDAEAA